MADPKRGHDPCQTTAVPTLNWTLCNLQKAPLRAGGQEGVWHVWGWGVWEAFLISQRGGKSGWPLAHPVEGGHCTLLALLRLWSPGKSKERVGRRGTSRWCHAPPLPAATPPRRNSCLQGCSLLSTQWFLCSPSFHLFLFLGCLYMPSCLLHLHCFALALFVCLQFINMESNISREWVW